MTWDPIYASGLLSAGATQGDLRRCLDAISSEEQYERLTRSECSDLGLPFLRPVLAQTDGLTPVLMTSEYYPSALKVTPSPPALLYVKGTLPKGMKAAAIVGSRRCSKIGESVSKSAVESIQAVRGCTVSGLALGCDTAGHTHSIEHGVLTVGVLACGLDSVYPRENAELAKKILDAGGALVSEQPPGTSVSPQRLMARNRMIAGMSFAMIPAECPRDSRGTIAAARMCVDYDRFLLLGRPKGRYRNHPGAWLVEACAEKSDDLYRVIPSKGKKVFSPNGVAESSEDLAEMMKLAYHFSQHAI
jgi:DNA protecting protein DprA